MFLILYFFFEKIILLTEDRGGEAADDFSMAIITARGSAERRNTAVAVRHESVKLPVPDPLT